MVDWWFWNVRSSSIYSHLANYNLFRELLVLYGKDLNILLFSTILKLTWHNYGFFFLNNNKSIFIASIRIFLFWF